MNQIEMVSLEDLVPKDHQYRKFLSIWDFRDIDIQLRQKETTNSYKGYGITTLFRCLLLQFMEDISDRELQRYLQENNTAKWFCGFGLCQRTPDYTVFSKVRSRLGTKFISTIFHNLRKQMQAQGLISEIFTFIDASHLIAKANLWEERDKAIKEKHDKLNNEILPKIAVDKQARMGSKGNHKHWYGYKKHVSVDMQSGLINKVALTPANVTDAQGLQHVCPKQGAVYADKGYCIKPATITAAKKGFHLRAIKKNNMKDKNPALDAWLSQLRSPYERVFAQDNKRVRYRGVAKNQFAAFMYAICFNLKRLTVLDDSSIVLH